MRLPAVNFYAPLLGEMISYCSACCEHYNSKEYKIPVLKGRTVMVETGTRNSCRASLMTECVSSYFVLRLFGQTLWSMHFLFGTWEVFFIEMFLVA